MMPTPVRFKYQAFLSYAQADIGLAKWLHRQLEGFRIDRDLIGRETPRGIVPKALRPIFRDREDFSGGALLTDSTVSALDQSAALVVLCSPTSASRPAVNEEVRLFRWRHSNRPVIPVIIDGTYPDNFPQALRFELGSDGSITDRPMTILGPDLREKADGRQLAVSKVVAGLLGVEPDEIYRRAARARRAARRFRNAVIALLAVLTIGAAGSAAYNFQQLRTSEAALDTTLAEFTRGVDNAVKSAEAHSVPLAFTRTMLDQAEGMLTIMSKLGASGSPRIEYRKAIMLAAFSDNYRSLGQTKTAKLRLDEAQRIMEGLVRSDPSDNNYQFTKAQLHEKAAALSSTLGDAEASVRQYRKRYEIMARLTLSDPSNANWQLELALARISLVDTYSMRDVTDDALESNREGLAMIERLAIGQPENAKLQRQLSIALTSIGIVEWQRGGVVAAQDNIGKALAIDQKLSAAEPNNDGLQRDLAKSLLFMASIRNVAGDRKGALPSAESANSILQRLTASDPDNAAWRSDLALAEMIVAILQAETNHGPASLEAARRARARIGKLVEADPGNVNLQQQIGMFDVQLSDLLIGSDQSQSALALLKSARTSFQHLSSIDPKSGMSLLMLVFIDAKSGTAFARIGQQGSALESYRSAVVMADKLARSDPSSAIFQQSLADSLNKVGSALAAHSKIAEALELFQKELSARQRLANIDHANIEWQTGVLTVRNRIAEALDKQGKTGDMVKFSRETLAEAEQFGRKASDNASFIWELFVSSNKVCDGSLRQNDTASAASACARMMELLRLLDRLAPNKFNVNLLALEKELHLKLGRFAEALALQEEIATRAQGEELKSLGKPGRNTSDALAELSYLALLAGEPEKSIAAAERSLELQPGDLAASLNRAHALMYLNRSADAQAAYGAHKDDLFSDGKSWPHQVVEDFAELRKAGREHPQMVEIEAVLGTTEKR